MRGDTPKALASFSGFWPKTNRLATARRRCSTRIASSRVLQERR